MYKQYWKSWNVVKDKDGTLILTQKTKTFSVRV